jgi:hypothetical protein
MREVNMASAILKTVLAIYATYALVKFVDFFYLSYDRRRRGLELAYRDGARLIRRYDAVALLVVVVIIALLLASGIDELSFGAGLLVGMTLIQVYFTDLSIRLRMTSNPPRRSRR